MGVRGCAVVDLIDALGFQMGLWGPGESKSTMRSKEDRQQETMEAVRLPLHQLICHEDWRYKPVISSPREPQI